MRRCGPLEGFVKNALLIVKCKAEKDGDLFKFKVQEVWKGKYAPDKFNEKPPDGYILTNNWHGNENPKDGDEVIFFFTQNSLYSKGILGAHSTAFQVKDGKIIYASTNMMLRKEYKVADFKNAILKIIRKGTK